MGDILGISSAGEAPLEPTASSRLSRHFCTYSQAQTSFEVPTSMTKKNQRGGAPKAKGRLAAALSSEQAAKALRDKKRAADAAREELAKAKASVEANAQLKKKRKLARAAEREAEKGKAKLEAEEGVDETMDGDDSDGSDDDDIQAKLDGLVAAADQKKGKKGAKAEPVKPAKAQRPKKKGTVPFALGERVLLVGEGNFSYAHALLLSTPAIINPHLLTATAFDSQAVAQEKYPDLMEHVNAIRAAGATVLFDVDATQLNKCKEVRDAKGRWDRVVFNFPHVGQGITDQNRNVRANQTLILNFLRSVGPLLRVGTSSTTDPRRAQSKSAKSKAAAANKASASNGKKRVRAQDSDDDDDDDVPVEDVVSDDDDALIPASLKLAPPPPTTSGTVLITLRTITPYSLWSLQHLGTRGSLLAPSILPRPLPKTPQPDFLVVRSFEFDPADWEGYEHRRTVGFKEGISSGKNDDLVLSARERGEKRREEKEEKERADKEEREGKEASRRGGKSLMRTYEFEMIPAKDEDDLYD